MKPWEKLISGGEEGRNLDQDILAAQNEVSRIQGLVEVEQGRYPDEENNTELQRSQKQLQGAKDKLNLLLEKQRREGEKVSKLTQ